MNYSFSQIPDLTENFIRELVASEGYIVTRRVEEIGSHAEKGPKGQGHYVWKEAELEERE